MPEHTHPHAGCNGEFVHATQLEALLEGQTAFQTGLNFASKAFDEGDTKKIKEMIDSLWATQRIHAGLLTSFIAPKYYATVFNYSGSKIAKQAFAIPEILEKIFLNLNLKDLLKAMQVNKQFYNCIDGSPRLQQNLSMKQSTHLFAPFNELILPGFDCHTGDRSHVTEKGVHQLTVDVAFLAGGCLSHPIDNLPKIGSRIRKMLISHPPCTEMEVFVSCCQSQMPEFMIAFDPRPRPKKIRKKTGLTIGNLYDQALKLKKEHANCVDALPAAYNFDGTVRIDVSFSGVIDLMPEDPAVKELEAGQKKMNEMNRKKGDQFARIAALAAAKIKARDDGKPIPTFAEFKVTQGWEDIDLKTCGDEHDDEEKKVEGDEEIDEEESDDEVEDDSEEEDDDEDEDDDEGEDSDNSDGLSMFAGVDFSRI